MRDALMTMTSEEWLGALADAWDFGYACGLGDYAKRDDECQSANPYRPDPPAEPQP